MMEAMKLLTILALAVCALAGCSAFERMVDVSTHPQFVDLQKEGEALKATIGDLQTSLEYLVEEKAALGKEIVALTEKVRSGDLSSEALQETTAAITLALGQISSTEADIEAVKGKIDVATDQWDNIQGRVETLVADLEAEGKPVSEWLVWLVGIASFFTGGMTPTMRPLIPGVGHILQSEAVTKGLQAIGMRSTKERRESRVGES